MGNLTSYLGRGIRDLYFSHFTYLQVFLIVTKESHFSYEDLNKGDSDAFDPELPVDSDIPDTSIRLEDSGKKSKKFIPRSYPMRALFRKNFVLQSRQTCSNVCQVLTPIIVVILLLILQSIIKTELGDDFDKVTDSPKKWRC
jgi:hypothetical protein